MINTERPIILLVEDEIDLNKYLTHILEPKYRVLCATSGAQALEHFSKYYTQLSAMILDVRLSDMSAFDLLDQFEKISFVGIPPCIIQTAYNDVEWIQNLLGEYRVLRYLVKPFEDDQLLEAVAMAIQSDPFVFKWSQINEKLDIIQLVGELRSQLYQRAIHLPEADRQKWLPKIMGLFQNFTLKIPLEDVFSWVVEFQPQLYLPEKKSFSIACTSQKIYDYIQVVSKEFAIYHVPIEGLRHPQIQYDFILLQLEEIQLTDQKAILQKNTGTYCVGVSFSKSHDILEKAIQQGMTFAVMASEESATHLSMVLARFAKRKHEVRTLEEIVDALS